MGLVLHTTGHVSTQARQTGNSFGGAPRGSDKRHRTAPTPQITLLLTKSPRATALYTFRLSISVHPSWCIQNDAKMSRELRGTSEQFPALAVFTQNLSSSAIPLKTTINSTGFCIMFNSHLKMWPQCLVRDVSIFR